MKCRFCDSGVTEILDFGKVALAGAFLKPSAFASEKKYPLRLGFCESCSAAQLLDLVEPAVMFKDYFYFTSSTQTGREHYRRYAGEISARFRPSSVLEIGCNDGGLLKLLADDGAKTVIGVDPASNVVGAISDPRVEIVNDFFDERIASQIVAQHGRMQMVIANNVIAHVPDINGFTQAICDVLHDDGVFIAESHYIGNMLLQTQYDWIYHEHAYYYSLISLSKHLSRFGLQVFDIQLRQTHGGSMRYYICKMGKWRVSDKVEQLAWDELRHGFGTIKAFRTFATNTERQRDSLVSLLGEFQANGARVVGYGACGRGNAVLQYCGLTSLGLPYIVDDAPAKVGFHTPGSHIPIYNREIMDKDRPDYALLFAWPYMDEIRAKCGLKMIVPFPTVHIIEQNRPHEEYVERRRIAVEQGI